MTDGLTQATEALIDSLQEIVDLIEEEESK